MVDENQHAANCPCHLHHTDDKPDDWMESTDPGDLRGPEGGDVVRLWRFPWARMHQAWRETFPHELAENHTETQPEQGRES